MCIDTAYVYVCIKKDINGEDTASNLTLKKINTANFDAIEERIKSIENEPRYIKINSETELPKDFTAVDFNPKTAYYIVNDKAAGFMSLYVFDVGAQSYVCTNKADMSVLEAKIEEAISNKFDDFTDEKFDDVLDTKLAEKVPDTVKTVLETRILFGGNSTTTTEDDILN